MRAGHDLFAKGEGRAFPTDVGLLQLVQTAEVKPFQHAPDLLDAFMAYQRTVMRKTLDYNAGNLGITLT